MEPTTQPSPAQTPKTGKGLTGKMSTRKFWLLIIALLSLVVLTAGALIYSQTIGQAPSGAQLIDSQVTVGANGFEPSTITVKKSQTVKWINKDSATHQLKADTPDNSPLKDGEVLGEGDEYSVIFENTGTFPYYDSQHTNLQGTVVVEE